METGLLRLTQENLEKHIPFKLEMGEPEIYVQDGHNVNTKVKLHFPDEVLEFFAEIKKEVRVHQLPGIYELV